MQLEVHELRHLIKDIIYNNLDNKAITRLVISNIKPVMSGLYIIYDIDDIQLYGTVINYNDLIKIIDGINCLNVDCDLLGVIE